VRKGDYLNIGIGRRSSANFAAHVNQFISFLEVNGKAPGASRLRWRGHAYLASGLGLRPIVADGLLLIGDAAGLAYPESGEGIRPSIESALLAARALISAAGGHQLEDLLPYQLSVAHLHPRANNMPPLARSACTMIGRVLLRSSWFTRHVVLDGWFLRSQRPTRSDNTASARSS
jgi:hypothetical protein